MPRKYALPFVRNIGIMAHIDAGKTTTSERILFFTGKTRKLGEVHDGNAVMDSMVQEQERGITIASAATTVNWENHGQDYRINLIDTPGHVDFMVEVERCLRVLDGAVAVFCAKGGVEPQSETVWHQANKYNVPRIAFINKMDINGANFHNVLDMMRARLKSNALPVQLPIGQADSFRGIIDVIERRAYYYDNDDITKFTVDRVPEDMVDEVELCRTALIECAAESDDVVMEKYFGGEDISVEEIKSGLRKATIALKCNPVFCGTAYRNKGIQQLLDGITDYLPSPVDVEHVTGFDVHDSSIGIERKTDDNEPFCGLAFKIVSDPYVGKLTYVRIYSGTLKSGSYVYNSSKDKKERIARILQMHAAHREEIEESYSGEIVAVVGLRLTQTGDTLCDEDTPILLDSIDFPEPVIRVAIEPRTQRGQEKMLTALIKLAEEDPTFKTYTDSETGQTIIAGMGELHLDIIVDRLLREFRVEADIGKPQVSYKETIRKSAEGEGKYIKQSGGKGQYGHVKIRMEPLESGKGYEFVSEIVGGVIPKELIEPVNDGIREASRNGVLAGFETVDFRAVLFDGSTHEVDSNEMAFKVAGSMAFKETMKKCDPYLLEPLMKVEVTVPDEYLGDVMSSITGRRGNILGSELRNGVMIVEATAPLSELFGYATTLRSISQGRGNFSMEFDKYCEVPKSIAEKLQKNKKQ
ncbi:MAG: elongation factor G [Clostridia bacterium]|nr:elongation factor G [Clostridia bacterium]